MTNYYEKLFEVTSLSYFILLFVFYLSGRKDSKYGIATVQYTLSLPNFHSYHLFLFMARDNGSYNLF